MAVRNIPEICPTSLTVNLQLATGMQSLQGDASNYGALKAVMSQRQDRVVEALDPRDCASKIWKDGDGKFAVTLEYHIPDCTEMDTDCADFTCTAGETATPTTDTTDFAIEQCTFFKTTLTHKDWDNMCCDVAPYYNQVLDARRTGGGQAAAAVLQRAINELSTTGNFDRLYNAKLLSEKIYNSFNAPFTGQLWKINDHALAKLKAGAGYNWAADPITGDPVAAGDWELPVLTSSVTAADPALIPYGLKRIDANLFRLYMEDFIRRHPRCGQGMTLVGGNIFAKLLAEVGIQAGVNDAGIDTAAVLRRALGFLGEYVQDDSIDAKYGDGSFFLLEENVATMFWLTLYGDPRYNTPNSYYWASTGKMVEKIKNFRDVGVLPITIGNCRNGNMTLPMDMFIHTPHVSTLACDANPTFNIQAKAQYEVFTRPAFGCANMNPTTGIYYGKLVDAITSIAE